MKFNGPPKKVNNYIIFLVYALHTIRQCIAKPVPRPGQRLHTSLIALWQRAGVRPLTKNEALLAQKPV
jgi:hypothetical protein